MRRPVQLTQHPAACLLGTLRLLCCIELLLYLPAAQAETLEVPATSATPAAQAVPTGQYELPGPQDQLIGTPRWRTATYEDTLAAIAQQEGVGFDALQRANGSVDPWLPGEGTALVLPTAMLLPDHHRDGVVVNLAERRLFYFDTDRERLLVYPVGIGRVDYPTPAISTKTVLRIHKPSWTPTASIRREREAQGITLPQVVPPGPDNPMGDYAIKLAAPALFIHGTNKPLGVGQRVSHGCLRLYADHIRELATQLPTGTPVRIINEPYKVAWHQGVLYLEAHPDASNAGALSAMVRQVIEATAAQPADVDWTLATDTARAATGIPVAIGTRRAAA